MIIKNGASPKTISTAAENLKNEKPHLKDVLDFYEVIFSLQEDVFKQLKSDPENLSEDLVELKVKNQFPLITKNDFSIDYKLSEQLFIKICQACSDFKTTTHSSMENLLKELNKTLTFNTLADTYIRQDLESHIDISMKTGIDIQNLDFLTYNALKPCIVSYAANISHYLTDDETTTQGYCPVCGSLPGFSLLTDNGKRSLVCSFCWHEWVFERILCPFCSTRDSIHLSYVTVEGEDGIRGDLCSNCKKYIKTIDIREFTRDVYLPLELLGAISLDIKLGQEGYQPGSANEEDYHQE